MQIICLYSLSSTNKLISMQNTIVESLEVVYVQIIDHSIEIDIVVKTLK